MFKELFLLTVVLGCAYVNAQMNSPLMMYALMNGSGGGGGGKGGAAGASGGGMNFMMNLLNNPYRLCKETEGVKAIPCRNSNICGIMSIRQYGLPNLMKCSPMGIGCCLKDFMSFQISKMM